MEKLSFFILLSALASFLAISAGAPSKLNCDQLLVKADNCFKDAILQSYAQLPVTADDVQAEYCVQLPARIKCIDSRRTCYGGFKRTLYDISAKNMRIFFRRQCKSPASRERMAKHMRCTQREGKLPYQKSIKRFNDEIVQMIELAVNQTQEDVIPYICCGYHYGIEKITNASVEDCRDKGIALKGKHFHVSLLTSTLGESIDLICGKYSSLDLCKANLKDGTAKIAKVVDTPQLPDIRYTVITALDKFMTVMDTSIDA